MCRKRISELEDRSFKSSNQKRKRMKKSKKKAYVTYGIPLKETIYALVEPREEKSRKLI